LSFVCSSAACQSSAAVDKRMFALYQERKDIFFN